MIEVEMINNTWNYDDDIESLYGHMNVFVKLQARSLD